MKHIVGLATDDHLTAKNMMESKQFITQWDCYEEVLDALQEQCQGHLNIPVVKHLILTLSSENLNICIEVTVKPLNKCRS